MNLPWLCTIGLFHEESKQLMSYVESQSFETYTGARLWALDRLGYWAPSPYQFNISPN